MGNRYKIETIQDIVECTNVDNVDSFLADIKLILLAAYKMKYVTVDNGKNIILKDLEWIDDGEHNIEIKIKKV